MHFTGKPVQVVGLTTNMIANMSKEGKDISMDTLVRICETLDCGMLDAMLTKKLEDENGILFVYFPVRQLAAEFSRCEMTVKRS